MKPTPTRAHAYKHLHTYTCTHTHTRTRTHTHTPTHIHPHTHTHTRTHAHTCTHVHTHTHVHTRAHTHTHTRAHTCTHVHTRAHTHKHTYTHARTPTHTHTPTHARTRAHATPTLEQPLHWNPCIACRLALLVFGHFPLCFRATRGSSRFSTQEEQPKERPPFPLWLSSRKRDLGWIIFTKCRETKAQPGVSGIKLQHLRHRSLERERERAGEPNRGLVWRRTSKTLPLGFAQNGGQRDMGMVPVRIKRESLLASDASSHSGDSQVLQSTPERMTVNCYALHAHGR